MDQLPPKQRQLIRLPMSAQALGSSGLAANAADPTDPTNPTDSTRPIDPTHPTDCTDPLDPSELTDPTDPTDAPDFDLLGDLNEADPDSPFLLEGAGGTTEGSRRRGGGGGPRKQQRYQRTGTLKAHHASGWLKSALRSASEDVKFAVFAHHVAVMNKVPPQPPLHPAPWHRSSIAPKTPMPSHVRHPYPPPPSLPAPESHRAGRDTMGAD